MNEPGHLLPHDRTSLDEFIENTFKYNLVDEAGITTIPPLDCQEKEPTVLRTDDYETYL